MVLVEKRNFVQNNLVTFVMATNKLGLKVCKMLEIKAVVIQ